MNYESLCYPLYPNKLDCNNYEIISLQSVWGFFDISIGLHSLHFFLFYQSLLFSPGFSFRFYPRRIFSFLHFIAYYLSHDEFLATPNCFECDVNERRKFTVIQLRWQTNFASQKSVLKNAVGRQIAIIGQWHWHISRYINVFEKFPSAISTVITPILKSLVILAI